MLLSFATSPEQEDGRDAGALPLIAALVLLAILLFWSPARKGLRPAPHRTPSPVPAPPDKPDPDDCPDGRCPYRPKKPSPRPR